MNQKLWQRFLSLGLGLVFSATSTQVIFGYQAAAPGPLADSGTPAAAAAQTAAQLQALVAPIALYPDSLVAQILTAATFPDEVAVADYWVGQNKSMTDNALMQAVDKQTWDPSVKALTQFPSVLANMSKNLAWTSSLGEAYHDQQADVMTAVQTLRTQAKAKGNLQSSSQITVVQQSPQVIVIQPTNPQIVYVPQYNPAIIYGTPYVVPSYTAGDVVAAGIIGFGAGIAVGAMMSGGCCGWGYSSWNCGWHGGGVVVFHGGGYYGNSAWHGAYYNGGYHSANGYNNSYNHNNYNNNYNHSNNNFKNSGNTYNKNTVNVNKQSAQSFQSNHSSGSNSWAQHDSSGSGHSNAFSGASGHSSGSNGWSSRADSGRGWGSMHSSGFSGGRFGGGGFGGGGFRR